jgi:hypothetical protein
MGLWRSPGNEVNTGIKRLSGDGEVQFTRKSDEVCVRVGLNDPDSMSYFHISDTWAK